MRPYVMGVLAVLCVVGCSTSQQPHPPHRFGFDILSIVPPDLLRQANAGRDVLREDGLFAFPRSVRRVWIDVGAHHLEQTRAHLLDSQDLGLVAVEPLSECWKTWPETDRLIGLPVALYLDRGHRDFNVNASDMTSSLAKGLPGAPLEKLRTTIEVRSVPVLRLEDVLERIPADLEITYLKTDVQSMDLQVLRFGGDELQRVFRVRCEVINDVRYQELDGEGGGTEQEFTEYLSQMGFHFVRDRGVQRDRVWLDKEYVNVEHARYTN